FFNRGHKLWHMALYFLPDVHLFRHSSPHFFELLHTVWVIIWQAPVFSAFFQSIFKFPFGLVVGVAERRNAHPAVAGIIQYFGLCDQIDRFFADVLRRFQTFLVSFGGLVG